MSPHAHLNHAGTTSTPAPAPPAQALRRSAGPAPVGLRGPDDSAAVLVCQRHLPLLRQLRAYEAERLGRYLHVAFQHTA